MVAATEEEAAEAYDIAAIKFRGLNAVTNFEMSRYDIEAIMSSTLPVGGTAKRLKLSLDSEQKSVTGASPQTQTGNHSSNINFGAFHPVSAIPCGVPFDSTTTFYQHNHLFHPFHSGNAIGSDSSATASTLATAMPLQAAAAELFIWPRSY